MSNYNYGTVIDEAKQLVASLVATKALEALPTVTVTFNGITVELAATSFNHLLNLETLSSRKTLAMEDTPANREKYAAYCERMALAGKEADIWETWSRRNASVAFVMTHDKQEDGSWKHNRTNEVLLRVQQNINKATDASLEPIASAIAEAIISNQTALLAI
jgi:hypothetical protein